MDVPKIIFHSEKPQATWNSAVQFIDFCIENPHKIVDDVRYSSRHVDFETNHKRGRIFLTMVTTHGVVGVYVNHVKFSLV